MLEKEVVEHEAEKAVGIKKENCTVTQKALYNMLVDFGMLIAKRADQAASKT